MKGNSQKFDSNYNKVGSSSVRIVCSYDNILITDKSKNGIVGIPNSVNIVKDENGNIIQERYYDENGNVYLDIDYTNHGNTKTHPIVPHEHSWSKDENGVIKRSKWKEISR